MVRPHQKWRPSIALLYGVFSILVHSTWGHGYLASPAAKQVIKGLGVTPVENGNSLGLHDIMATSQLPRQGICGDPFEGAFNDLYPLTNMPYDNTWAAHLTDGGTLNITITLAANYTGYHVFHVSTVTDSTGLPPLDMYNQTTAADNVLQATGLQSGINMPLAGDTQWFIRSQPDPNQPWESYTAEFRLPPFIATDMDMSVPAILRWKWVVRKDCSLLCAGLPANSTQSCGPYPLVTPANCDSLPDPLYVFSNCADILISPLPPVNNPVIDPYAPLPPPVTPAYPPAPFPPAPPPWPAAYQPYTNVPPAPLPTSCISDLDSFCSFKGLGTGTFPDPCSCTSFIVCDSGFTGSFGVSQTCPGNTTFNAQSGVCDNSGIATCGAGAGRRRLEELKAWKF